MSACRRAFAPYRDTGSTTGLLNAKKLKQQKRGTIQAPRIAPSTHRIQVPQVTTPSVPKSVDYQFDSFPFKVTPRSRRLLAMYFTTLAGHMYPLDTHLTVNPIKTQSRFEDVTSDPLMFQACMFTATAGAYVLGVSSDPNESSRERGKTICMVNQHLSKTQVDISNTLLDTVITLAVGEVSSTAQI